MIKSTGMEIIGGWRQMRRTVAVLVTVLAASCQPSQWRRTVVEVLMRQIYFAGALATRFTIFMGILVGVSVVLQAELWLRAVGQSTLLAPLLVAIIVRQLGPLLVNLVVIGRSGSAIAVELANMTVTGQIDVLESQGVDPFRYLVVPRVVALAVSVACLTVLFIVTSLGSGYLCGLLIGTYPGPPGQFLDDLLRAFSGADALNLAAATLLPALLTGTICCVQGMSVAQTINDVPRAITRAMSQSVATLFIVMVALTLLSYL